MAGILTVGLVCSVAAADFSDVSERDWFYEELDLMVERGIVSGYEDGTFRPDNTVSVGEVSKMLYVYQEDATLANGSSHWAENYVDAAYFMTWLDSVPEDLDTGATRAQVCEMVLSALGFVADPYLDSPFVDTSNTAAVTLYTMGVINGSDETGGLMLRGEDTITRAEFCAILDRVETYMTTQYGITDFRYQLPQVTMPGSPEFTYDYFYDLFLYMIVTQQDTLTLNFFNMTNVQVEEAGKDLANQAFWAAQSDYHELGAFYDKLSHNWTYNGWSATTWTIQISDNDLPIGTTKAYQTEFILGVPYYAKEIATAGKVTANMSDYETAKYLYQFMAANFYYDYNFIPVSYNGYGMMANGAGVCQGYVSVYNALCKMFGVDIVGVKGTTSGENHIWSYANLDGSWLYIDPTWGDCYRDGVTADLGYFALSRAKLEKTHTFED